MAEVNTSAGSPAPTSAPAPAPGPSKGKVFLRRLFSSVMLWTVVITALFSGNKVISDWFFVGIMTLLAVTGLLEFYGMVEKRGLVCFKGWGVFGGVLLMTSTFFYVSGFLGPKDPARPADFESSIIVIFVLGLCVKQFTSKTNTAGILAISTTLFGLMYVPWLLNFVQKINYFPRINDNGHWYVLYFILVTKFSDLGAYVTGSLIGKHKMIPRISPGKTWEGFGGAIVISTGVSVAFAHFAAAKLPGMNLMHAVILGIMLSIAAVIGDLIESLFKRESGVKDSGAFFPGIGGILDLLDSILFNAPLMYLYLRHVLTH
ncbi:MAG TPA: phosphatidate cytidylyltransferase [Verrucomicrobiae bacterium]